jgi:hypothetical protein
MSTVEVPERPPAPPKPVRTKTDAGRGRRIAVMVLIVVATLIGFASSLTVWVKRQALDTKAITNASSQMLQDDQIRSALSLYLVDQLYANTNVAADLKARLPKNLQPIAAPLAGALRELSVRAANTLLSRPRVQHLFANSVRAAHAAFIRVIDGKAKRLSSDGGVVFLDLRPLLGQLSDQIGIAKKLQAKLPPNAGRIEIMKQNQLDAIKTGARTIKALTVFLAIVMLALYALAIYLARGYRRATLRSVGVAIIVVGVLLLVIRRVAGNMIIDTLASGGGTHTPGHHLWLIATSMLADIAWAAIGYGLVAVIAAILAGSTRPARWIRRQLAPSFCDHIGLVYTTVAVAYLLLLLWAPTRAQREWIWVIVFAMLLGLGTELFRRQTLREFPTEGGSKQSAVPG